MDRRFILLLIFAFAVSCYYYGAYGAIAPPTSTFHHRSYSYHRSYPAGYYRAPYTTQYGVPYGYSPAYDYHAPYNPYY